MKSLHQKKLKKLDLDNPVGLTTNIQEIQEKELHRHTIC